MVDEIRDEMLAKTASSKAVSKVISKVLSKRILSILMKQVLSSTPNPNEEGWSLLNPKNTKIFQRRAKVYHCYQPTARGAAR